MIAVVVAEGSRLVAQSTVVFAVLGGLGFVVRRRIRCVVDGWVARFDRKQVTR